MKLPDRYKVTGASLQGGMSSVLPCTDEVLERKVAIKVISSTTDQRRVLDEVGALLKLRSKHVVQIYDVLALAGQKLAIVQEFVEGSDLDLKRSPVTTADELYRQLWQVAAGIADIHAAGLIHRDIKPNNMKRDAEGVIKIFDFGLARSEGPDAKTKGFVGTQGFAAPELFRGAARFTQAVDTYAFGISALYFASGSLPPELRAMPPTPGESSYFAGLPHELAPEIIDVLDACLAFDPNDRPLMSEVRDLLARRLLSGKHQALVVYDGKSTYLNAQRPTVNLKVDGVGQASIKYDGLDFTVPSAEGEVFVNNQALAAGASLPGSCVIAFGAPERGGDRRYITVDVSHPEVVL